MAGDEYARRPTYSPALGIPDMWWLIGRASAVQALVGNKKWTTNAAPIVATGANQIAATLSMKALVTGRFRVRASGVVASNSIAGGNTVEFGVSHGTGVTVADYAQPPVTLAAVGAEVFTGLLWMSIIVDYTSLAAPFVAPLGSTTDLNLIMNGTIGTVEFQIDGVQFEAEEF